MKRNKVDVTNEKDVSEFEDVVHQSLGDLGKYQIVLNVLLALMYIPCSWQMLSMNFLAAKSDYWCARPDNLNVSSQRWLEFSRVKKDGGEIDHCKIYDFDYNDADFEPNNETAYKTCEAFEYDTSFWSTTVRQKWDLVCDDAPWYGYLNSIFMSGVALGVIVFGIVSDHFGRKPTTYFLLLLQMVSTLAAAFVEDFTLWVVLRWFAYFSTMSLLTVKYVLGMEFLSGKHRAYIGIGLTNFYPVGLLSYTFLGWILRDSFKIQVAMGLCNVPLLLLYFITPESPRWLIGKNRLEEAEKILRKGAKINGRVLPDKLDFHLNKKENTSTNAHEEKVSILSLFKSPRLRIYTIASYIIWFAHGFSYYGMGLNIGDIGGDLFINYFIFGAVDIPAFCFSIFMLTYVRRREYLFTAMSLSGACLLLTMAFDKGVYPGDWPIVAFAMSGKLFLSATFISIYLYTIEIYPTLARNVGIGSSSTWARIGSIVAPMTYNLKPYDPKFFPTGLLGLVFILCAFSLFVLPETLNRPLLRTMEELEKEDFRSGMLFTCNSSSEDDEDRNKNSMELKRVA